MPYAWSRSKIGTPRKVFIGGWAGREPERARMGAPTSVEPDRHRLVDQQAEDTAAAGEIADRLPGVSPSMPTARKAVDLAAAGIQPGRSRPGRGSRAPRTLRRSARAQPRVRSLENCLEVGEAARPASDRPPSGGAASRPQAPSQSLSVDTTVSQTVTKPDGATPVPPYSAALETKGAEDARHRDSSVSPELTIPRRERRLPRDTGAGLHDAGRPRHRRGRFGYAMFTARWSPIPSMPCWS